MSALLDATRVWLPKAVKVYARVQSAAHDLDVAAVLAFPELRGSVERGRHYLREAERTHDDALAQKAIAAFRGAIGRCPRHLTDLVVERPAPRTLARSSALVDVPRVAMPRAIKAFSLIVRHARTDAVLARVLPRAQAAMDRGRQVWTEAERRRDDALAQEAAHLFDEVTSLLPAHLRSPERDRPPTATTTRTR